MRAPIAQFEFRDAPLARPRRRRRLCVPLAAPALCAAAADQQWTFCVASTRGGDDVWITDVFAATRGHKRLEGELKAYLASRGASRIDAQCPAPAADKTAAVNAQFAAVEFNRKLGSALHEARRGTSCANAEPVIASEATRSSFAPAKLLS